MHIKPIFNYIMLANLIVVHDLFVGLILYY